MAVENERSINSAFIASPSPNIRHSLPLFSTVEIELQDTSATVKMNRPEKLNALDAQLRQDLLAALDWLRSLPGLAAIVLTGSTARAFSAGADLGELRQLTGASLRDREIRESRELTDEVMEFPVPIIAAIRGYALGGGLELALACDMRVASTTSQLALPEVSYGFLPGTGGTQRLTRIVGVGRAMRLILMCERISGAQAEAFGIVEWAVPDEDVLSTARSIADRIGRHDLNAIRMAKRAIRQGSEMPLGSALGLEKALNYSCFNTIGPSTDAPEFRDIQSKNGS